MASLYLSLQLWIKESTENKLRIQAATQPLDSTYKFITLIALNETWQSKQIFCSLSEMTLLLFSLTA